MLCEAEFQVDPAESPWTTSALPQTSNTMALRNGRAVNGSKVALSSSTRRFDHVPTPSERSAEVDGTCPRLRPPARAPPR